VRKVSKAKKKNSKKKPGGGGGQGENKVPKKTEIRADRGKQKESEPGMAQG
jgi:hypothetical protein